MPKPSTSARETLALNLIRLRGKLGWTQEVLAHEAGIHRTYIGDLERQARNVSIDNIERLAHALGVETWVLLKRAQ
ncbi:helix-turn-helix domain-containing protein [Vitreimonas flagellata]|uniref:helix-turn-helix domain-containing protein n=1 Tax=Vitreimonas flagellata TaxID=2560861 RepID=UPI00107538DB|nr:helix-turn-helix transcriptional regulator [Vitreimonas flagellata]